MDYSKNASSGVAFVNVAVAFLRAIRPKQWTKNLAIYLAFFFTINEAWSPSNTGEMLSLLIKSTLAFIIFAALSGAVYLVNDIFDVEKDRRHPKKRLRPIASGQLAPPLAGTGAAALTVAGLTAAFLLEPLFGWVSLAYVTTNVAYTLALRQLVLLDVFAISAGFVLRVLAGATVLDVPISSWLYICTGLGSLFIALSKRRSELALGGTNAAGQRGTLRWYSTRLLDYFIAASGFAAVSAYSLYTVTARNLPENYTMTITIPFVVYGLLRYWYLVHTKDLGETPEDILATDRPLIISILLWLAVAATVLVIFRG